MQLAFGCSRLASASAGNGSREAIRLVQEAVDRGVTIFDTADAYSAGMSERLLGVALRGRRASVIIATKGGYRFRPRSRLEQAARRSITPVVRARSAPGPGRPAAGGGYGDQDFPPWCSDAGSTTASAVWGRTTLTSISSTDHT